ncbi:MAG: hypothetical protein ACRD9S_14600 [Pyrinomonadaceae bacterium]
MQLFKVLLVFCLIGSGVMTVVHSSSVPSPTPRDNAGARAAFIDAYKVLMSPRCLNCHPVGDFPLQGDDSLPHLYRVRRGEDGNGVYSMKCSNCHQAANQRGMNMPPGAPSLSRNGSLDATPRWRLPSAKTPMVFQGRTPSQLCRQLKNPTQNGGMTPERLIVHVATDPLVLWGWNPGEGRTKPPLTHDKFVASVEEWLEKGGACPK